MHLWEDNGEGSNGSGSVGSLKLVRISKIESLPRGIACLPALQTLNLSQLHSLREIPEWIGHLSNLKSLKIEECPKVTQLPESLCELTLLERLTIFQCNPRMESRCQETTGEDWPKIKHISNIHVNQFGEEPIDVMNGWQ